MLRQVIVIAFCLLQGYYFLDRDQIISDYQPTLIEKAANITKEYNTVKTEATLITNQIKNETFTTVTLINSQITTVKNSITAAKNTSDTSVVQCLTAQQTAINTLTATPINETCWVDATFPDLTTARDSFSVLAKVPNNTISACEILDPLASQDELFLSCISNKILDLDDQLQILLDNFNDVRMEALNTNIQCLAEQSALIGQKLSEIEFEITLCLS